MRVGCLLFVVRGARPGGDDRSLGRPRRRIRRVLDAGADGTGGAAAAARAAKAQPKYVSAPVPKPGKKPFRAAGKVYLQLGNKLFVCSGAIVKAPSRSLVWTAAHCLRDLGPRGKFAKHWIFVPDYDRRRAPFGGWEAKAMYVPTVWALGNQSYDFGAAVVRRNRGRSIQRAVGAALPIGFNPRARQSWTAVGYPEAKRWNQDMWFCAGRLYRRDRLPWRGPDPIGIGCDMNGGASGGPWITERGKLGAVSSYIYRRGPDVLYGTYLGKKAKKLYAKVRKKR